MKNGESVLNMKSLWIKTLVILVALVIGSPLAPALAADESYPSKPIRLVISFAPGGSNDIIARLIATKLSEKLGQRVVPENRAGAGGIIGNEVVAKADPDGYTLLFVSVAMSTTPSIYKLPYDPVKSFIPIAKVGYGPYVLCVHPDVPVNSVKELIALAKKEPGKLACAVGGGVGGFMHMSIELFKMMAGGLDMKSVQFKGGGPAMINTMGGHTQIILTSLMSVLPHIKSGKLKALGVAGSVRSKKLPDVPTISEAGLPGYEANIWWGIFAPAGTPKAVCDILYKNIKLVINSDDTKKLFEARGAEPDLMDSSEFAKFIQAETSKWAKVVKAANIKVK